MVLCGGVSCCVVWCDPFDYMAYNISPPPPQVVSVVDKELIAIPEPDPLRNYVDKKGRVVEDSNPAIRPLTPIQIMQPLGPSFRVEGYHVSWDKWNFRVGFTPKEGLVIHTVSLFDPDKNKMRYVCWCWCWWKFFFVLSWGDEE